ncbi:hypothetical protein C8Q76DRAFT_767047 [Earliella scabrosa]|nr:hypothetical protein C8Q76DRAFT_767047 [Earliella scabrosa]
MEVAGRTQFLTAAQTMPPKVEQKIIKIIINFVWKDDRHPRISRETLYKPISEGGLGLVDIAARNEAIDLMWLRSYLTLGERRPKWAYVADALIARAVIAADRNVEEAAKVNLFLQTWKVNTRRGRDLPEDLRRMLKAGEKYKVRIEAPNPAKKMKLALPLWYHIGRSEGSKCLRQNHGVATERPRMRQPGQMRRRGEKAPREDHPTLGPGGRYA